MHCILAKNLFPPLYGNSNMLIKWGTFAPSSYDSSLLKLKCVIFRLFTETQRPPVSSNKYKQVVDLAFTCKHCCFQSIFCLNTLTSQHSNTGTTNGVSLGRGCLFAWPMGDKGNLFENSHYFSHHWAQKLHTSAFKLKKKHIHTHKQTHTYPI